MGLEAWAWGSREGLSEGLGDEGHATEDNANTPGSIPGKEEQLSHLSQLWLVAMSLNPRPPHRNQEGRTFQQYPD